MGAGWIGAEVACSARQLGLDVTLVEMGDVPVERVLGREVGSMTTATCTSSTASAFRGGMPRSASGGRGYSGARGARRRRRRGHRPRGGRRGRDAPHPAGRAAARLRWRTAHRGERPARALSASAGIFAARATWRTPSIRYIRPPPARGALGQRADRGPAAARNMLTADVPSACPASSPTSTTWAWSTPASRSTQRWSFRDAAKRDRLLAEGGACRRHLRGRCGCGTLNEEMKLVRSGGPAGPRGAQRLTCWRRDEQCLHRRHVGLHGHPVGWPEHQPPAGPRADQRGRHAVRRRERMSLVRLHGMWLLDALGPDR